MSKAGRKGRISNELVAASCAAILAVYASGYWRTRDEDRRFGTEVPRRPVRPAPQVPAAPLSVASDLPVTGAGASESLVAEPAPAATETATAVVVPAPTQKPAAAEPSKAAGVALTSVSVEPQSEPVPEAAAAEAAAPLVVPAGTWHDGYFTGWGQSRHGDIEASVSIKDGRIVNAAIVTCATRYPCSVIDSIVNQPVLWQSPDVDRISRATESADAYYWALVEALKKSETWQAPPATSP